jgi:hypothetical protein
MTPEKAARVARLIGLPGDDIVAVQNVGYCDRRPDSALMVWRVLLAHAPVNPNADWLTAEVLRSMLIDLVTNQMERDPAFAVKVGERITTLLNALDESVNTR